MMTNRWLIVSFRLVCYRCQLIRLQLDYLWLRIVFIFSIAIDQFFIRLAGLERIIESLILARFSLKIYFIRSPLIFKGYTVLNRIKFPLVDSTLHEIIAWTFCIWWRVQSLRRVYCRPRREDLDRCNFDWVNFFQRIIVSGRNGFCFNWFSDLL